MFTIGKTYKRSELHKAYGGQKRGGISTPADHNFILIFTGEQGQQYGYRDEWAPEGYFTYTGEGQQGDMIFVRGNAAIRDHIKNGKDIHLFQYLKKGHVRYIGQMVCTGFRERIGPDVDGNNRKVIVFELTPINAFDPAAVLGAPEDEAELWNLDLHDLRQKAVSSSTAGKTPVERKMLVWQRSQAIKVYVLKRANGVCEACKNKAPFMTGADRPYLEQHHIRRLSDGGPDHPAWVIGVCPNCHRRAHHSEDRAVFTRELIRIVAGKEKAKG